MFMRNWCLWISLKPVAVIYLSLFSQTLWWYFIYAYYLLSFSITSCSLPQEWKTDKICPNFKGDDTSCASNYRPISLLCILSKVLESIVYQNIIHFLWPLISTRQHGFLLGKFCLTQLLHFYSENLKLLDNGSPTDVVFVEFWKVFDTVPHSGLLFKLWSLGLTGPL